MTRASVVLLCLALAGCGTAERPGRHLVVAAPRDMTALMDDVARRFGRHDPDVLVSVDPNGERTAPDVRTGLADVGVLERPLRPDEADLSAIPLAIDGIAVLVHRDNPVRALDARQVSGLYSGQYTNWREVGGPDRPVTLVGLAPGRPMRDVFLAYFSLPASTKTESPAVTCEQAIAAVAASPDAIGYTSLGCALREPAVRPLALGGVAATLDELRAGRYPLTRPLLLLTRRKPEGTIGRFLDFARSDEIRGVLDEHGLVPARSPE